MAEKLVSTRFGSVFLPATPVMTNGDGYGLSRPEHLGGGGYSIWRVARRFVRGGIIFRMTPTRSLLVLGVIALALLSGAATGAAPLALTAPNAASVSTIYRIDHVTDGDTVVLQNGQRVRLVQIDTPEVYFGTECYGPQASATTKRLLPSGAVVRLTPEPATDRLDQYGRLLRYVVRARDRLNVNIRLVALGAAGAVLLPRQARAPGWA